MQYISTRLTKKKVFALIAGIIFMVVSSLFIVYTPSLLGGDATKADSANSTPTAFLMEVYNTIDKHFWKDLSTKQLTTFFVRGTRKLTDQTIKAVSKQSTLQTQLKRVIDRMNKQERRQFPARLASLVLKSLPPQGRSRLYTEKKKRQLAKRVKNVDGGKSLFSILGVATSSKEAKIKQAYQKKREKLTQQPQSTSTQKKMKQLTYAKNVLTDEEDRQQYTETKAEPTVFTDRISEDVVHLGIHRYNQDTLNEFTEAVKGVDMTPQPTSLIIDLRSNLGGSIGVLPYLLGPFIGPNRLAYRFFQQGDKKKFKTKTGWMEALVPYKKVVILVNDKTQSTGELMASVLKKFNVGTVVGTNTRGWGTVERVFSLENQYRDDRKYSLFLVHHLTLRADGKPIQARGIVPEVKMNKADWRQKLRTYIPHPPLIRAVEQVWNTPPPGTEV